MQLPISKNKNQFQNFENPYSPMKKLLISTHVIFWPAALINLYVTAFWLIRPLIAGPSGDAILGFLVIFLTAILAAVKLNGDGEDPIRFEPNLYARTWAKATYLVAVVSATGLWFLGELTRGPRF
jgi:hypothetical protein